MAIQRIGAGHQVQVADEVQEIPADFLAESLSELSEASRLLARVIESEGRIVDEYLPITTLGSESSIELLPQFERLWERIEHIIITGPPQGTGTNFASGSATSPGANALITQSPVVNLIPGTYTIQWKVDLDGTVSATDVNNFQLVFGSTSRTSANNGVVGSYPQEPIILTIPQGNTNPIQIRSVIAGTVGAVYTGQLSLTPSGGFPVTLQLGDRFWNLIMPPTGILEINPKCLLLSPQHRRILTAVFAGNYTLELLGYADVRNRR